MLGRERRPAAETMRIPRRMLIASIRRHLTPGVASGFGMAALTLGSTVHVREPVWAISSVATTPLRANARSCLAGETIRVVARFNSAVQVTASPTLAINAGEMEKPATFDSVQP